MGIVVLSLFCRSICSLQIPLLCILLCFLLQESLDMMGYDLVSLGRFLLVFHLDSLLQRVCLLPHLLQLDLLDSFLVTLLLYLSMGFLLVIRCLTLLPCLVVPLILLLLVCCGFLAFSCVFYRILLIRIYLVIPQRLSLRLISSLLLLLFLSVLGSFHLFLVCILLRR